MQQAVQRCPSASCGSLRITQRGSTRKAQRRQSHVARYRQDTPAELAQAPLISEETIVELEGELHCGESMAALRRFNAALAALPASGDEARVDAQSDAQWCSVGASAWRPALTRVLAEFTFNLESFNPAFAHVVLMVQKTIGQSDYGRRDAALKRLIVPLAGEYGMHNGEAQGQTHRELFDSWVRSLLGRSAHDLIQTEADPALGKTLFDQMMRDIGGGGGRPSCPLTHAAYALGYNLAIEYLADYEKRWMLESFRKLDAKVFAPAGRDLDWVFLEVHAADEMEHAELGHEAVRALVPAQLAPEVRRAMHDHDRDFAVFYNGLAAILEGAQR